MLDKNDGFSDQEYGYEKHDAMWKPTSMGDQDQTPGNDDQTQNLWMPRRHEGKKRQVQKKCD